MATTITNVRRLSRVTGRNGERSASASALSFTGFMSDPHAECHPCG